MTTPLKDKIAYDITSAAAAIDRSEKFVRREIHAGRLWAGGGRPPVPLRWLP